MTAPAQAVISATPVADDGGDTAVPAKSAPSAGANATGAASSHAPTKSASVRRRQTASSSGDGKEPLDAASGGLMTIDNSEEMVQAIFNAILYQAHMEVRGPTALPFSGNSAEGARSYIETSYMLARHSIWWVPNCKRLRRA